MLEVGCDTSSTVSRTYERLMAAARDPADIATLALGGVLARFALQGVNDTDLQRLLDCYFPGAQPVQVTEQDQVVCMALSADEYADLTALLYEFRRDDSEENRWVIQAIASACAGANHLWQDMGLPSRDVLSQLMRRYFPVLYYKNSKNMKWKKFFYKQLCDRAEVPVCKAPSCGVCSDYVNCFGPE